MASVRVSGPLNTELLRGSIQAVWRRHESLRTRIVLIDGIPRQCVDDYSGYELATIDLARMPTERAEEAAKYIAHDFSEARTDLSSGQLFEAKLLRLADQEHVLLLALDHMTADAVSCAILARDIWGFYTQAAQGRSFSLPALPIQFPDYAVWEQGTAGAWLTQCEAHWRQQLAGAPDLRFPTASHSPGLQQVTDGATLYLPVRVPLDGRLRDVARRERTLLPLVVLTVYIAVVARWCNQRDFVLAFQSHGRHGRPELENMIGFLSHRLCLRVESLSEDKFLDLLKRVTLEFPSAYQNQDSHRALDLIPGWAPQLQFNWIPTQWGRRRPTIEPEETSGELRIQPLPMEPTQIGMIEPSSYIAALCSENASSIDMTVWYPSHEFSPGTMEWFATHLRLFSEQFMHDSNTRITSVPLSS